MYLVDQWCNQYEKNIRELGGIGFFLGGIGPDGHIAFNEPGSSLGSRTRIKTLTEKTRLDNARFFADMDEVPKYAITMGVGTIMDSKEIVLIANDITQKAGSFGTMEDKLFSAATEYARTRGIPRIYLAANSGARIGMAEEVKEAYKVAWVNEADPSKGFNYIY